MLRELTSHKTNGMNEGLKIQVLDQPGNGNACRKYHITTVETPPPVGGGMSSESLEKAMSMSKAVHDIRFQDGNPNEVGINGITNESLLAIVEDRLAGFQSGEFASRETAVALTKIQEAMMWLQKRTMDRIRRGVEGMNAK